MSDPDIPDQGLPGDGDGEEAPLASPPLATDPILTNAIDVPGLANPVDASAAQAISSAQEAAKAQSSS